MNWYAALIAAGALIALGTWAIFCAWAGAKAMDMFNNSLAAGLITCHSLLLGLPFIVFVGLVA